MRKITMMLVFLMFTGLNFAFAQTRTISGVITSADDGNPLPGVTVQVQGTTVGTTTDLNGKYSLSVTPTQGNTLLFSFVGMATQKILIGSSNTINVVMKSSAMAINEVVVTALGIKREKRSVTYQTQKVVSSDLIDAAPTRAASGLIGKVAGLQINVQDNGVNPSSQIILRGLRSVSGNNSALIVIDGSIASQGAFDDLNPNDIASISVLKGATAGALYGSNASNGALLVTTKKGAGKKLTVGLNSSFTMEKVAYMPNFQSKYGTGWEGVYDPRENTNWGPRYDGTIRRVGPVFPAGYGVATQMIPYAPVKNNLLDFYQIGGTENNTVYLSGSDKTSSFYASFGDQRSDGIVPNDTYKRNSARVNASKKFGNVTLSATSNYFSDKTDVVGNTIGAQDRNLYWFVLNTSTNIPLSTYSDWQNPLSYGYADNYQNSYYQNPYWAIGTNRNIDYTSRFIGNFNLSWDINKWLNFTTRFGTNNVWGNGKNWRAGQTYDPVLKPQMTTVPSFVEDSEFKSTTYTGDALLSGDFKYGESFTLKAILGYSVNASDYRSSLIRANNLSIPDFYDISNGTGSLVGSVYNQSKRTYGYFTDLTFGYKNYLFLNLTGREDWTSTLAKGNNSYFYPGVGLSFVFTDAFPALKDNSVISYGKFTVSNSTVYNDLNPYVINETYSQASGFPYGSINGFYLSNTAVDANITKEKINTTEFGLNMGFFDGRLNFDGSYFNTTTSNLITSTTPSVASGSTVFLTNIGELQGKGLELTLGGTAIKTSSFRWDMSLNYTHYETVVKSIKPGLDEIAVATTGQVGVYAVVGQAFPQMKANVYKRDPQGRIIIDASTGYPLTETALANLGKTTPDYILGFTSTAKFKGFTLSVTTDYRTGHVYYEQGSDRMEFTGRSLESVSANRQDFVIPNSVVETSPGVYVPNTNIPVRGGLQDYWTDVYNNVKSNYVKDATAFKVRELSLSYTLPSKLLRKTALSKVSIGLVARNIFTRLPAENRFSDPEFNNTNSNAIGIGGYLQSPPTKTYGFNLNVEF